MLQGRILDQGTVQELISASTDVGWLDLEPFLVELTTGLKDGAGHPVEQFVSGAEAAIVLLGGCFSSSFVSFAVNKKAITVIPTKQLFPFCKLQHQLLHEYYTFAALVEMALFRQLALLLCSLCSCVVTCSGQQAIQVP